jgi:AraC-like DNA-binding protein
LNTGRIKRSKHSKSRRKQDTGDTYDELRKAKEANTVRDLLDYFENEKPYLNNILSLKELADELGIPVNQLSHIINERIGKNFFDFVNTYRVEEFKSRASHPDFQNYTLISIAYDSGFNSKATFNRVFKKYTGQTPSNYYHNIPRS